MDDKEDPALLAGEPNGGSGEVAEQTEDAEQASPTEVAVRTGTAPWSHPWEGLIIRLSEPKCGTDKVKNIIYAVLQAEILEQVNGEWQRKSLLARVPLRRNHHKAAKRMKKMLISTMRDTISPKRYYIVRAAFLVKQAARKKKTMRKYLGKPEIKHLAVSERTHILRGAPYGHCLCDRASAVFCAQCRQWMCPRRCGGCRHSWGSMIASWSSTYEGSSPVARIVMLGKLYEGLWMYMNDKDTSIRIAYLDAWDRMSRLTRSTGKKLTNLAAGRSLMGYGLHTVDDNTYLDGINELVANLKEVQLMLNQGISESVGLRLCSLTPGRSEDTLEKLLSDKGE